MFIFNVKVKGSLLLKFLIIFLSIIMLIIFAITIYRIFVKDGNFFVSDSILKKDITEIDSSNYTNILQAVHDNTDSYVGMKIKFTGYVYRVLDFNDNEFVLARDMLINKENTQAVVVGFLCTYKDAEDFEDGTWVNVTGTIKKGKYHNQEIPIIEIKSLEETDEPEEEFVLPPNNSYVPTSAMF